MGRIEEVKRSWTETSMDEYNMGVALLAESTDKAVRIDEVKRSMMVLSTF